MMAPNALAHPLISYIAGLHGVPAATLLGPSKRREFFLPRAIACWLCLQEGLNVSATARLLNRHHTSILHAVAYVQDRPELLRHAQECRRLLHHQRARAADWRTA